MFQIRDTIVAQNLKNSFGNFSTRNLQFGVATKNLQRTFVQIFPIPTMNFCYFPNNRSFNVHLEQKNCSNLGKKFKPRNALKDKRLVFIYSAATICAGLGTIGFAFRKRPRFCNYSAYRRQNASGEIRLEKSNKT